MRRCRDCAAIRKKRDAEIERECEVEFREHQRRVDTGEVFRPFAAELQSALIPVEFRNLNTAWRLQPEFYEEYREGNINTIADAIADAESRVDGFVFLVSDHGGQLNIGLSATFGVCEYINEGNGHWLYAYTSDNLAEQVDKQNHVVQSCPCCGVGMLWYPSRFHFPRSMTIDLARRVSQNMIPDGIKWLDSGDFSLTEHGRG